MYVLLLRSGPRVMEAVAADCDSDDAAILGAFHRFEIMCSLDWENPNVDVFAGGRMICNIGEVF